MGYVFSVVVFGAVLVRLNDGLDCVVVGMVDCIGKVALVGTRLGIVSLLLVGSAG